MVELAVSVNHPSGALKHHDLDIDDNTSVGDVRNQVGAHDIDAIILHLRGKKFFWEEPNDSIPVTDLLDGEAEKTLLLFHPGGWEEVIGNPFDVHPRYKPR